MLSLSPGVGPVYSRVWTSSLRTAALQSVCDSTALSSTAPYEMILPVLIVQETFPSPVNVRTQRCSHLLEEKY